MRIFFPSFFFSFFFFTRIHKHIHRLPRVCRIRIYKYTYSHIAHGCNIRPYTHTRTHAHAHRSSYHFKILREFVHKASHTISCRFSHTDVITTRRDTRSSIYLSICFCYRRGSVNMYIAANFALATTIKTTQDDARETRIKLPRHKLDRE